MNSPAVVRVPSQPLQAIRNPASARATHGAPPRFTFAAPLAAAVTWRVAQTARAAKAREVRRRPWLSLAGAAGVAPENAEAEECEGSVFNGTWSIPESLGGKASIVVKDGTATISGSKEGKEWKLISTGIQGAH